MTAEPQPALKHRCPFCYADPGQPCRTHRGRGRELDWPHSRRLVLASPETQAIQAEARKPLDALCCECGNLRTVGRNYYTPRDENSGGGLFSDPRGWFDTGTLKCSNCRRSTRHALLAKDHLSDLTERYQTYVLGGESPYTWQLDEENRQQLREKYFAQFPRNPNLHHWFDTALANEARERGDTHMPALCGCTATVPQSWSGKSGNNDAVSPGRIDWDTEFEDDKGMWWLDMDCVDCLRVANENRRGRRRTLLESWLAWFAAHPEAIPEEESSALYGLFEPLVHAINEQKS